MIEIMITAMCITIAFVAILIAIGAQIKESRDKRYKETLTKAMERDALRFAAERKLEEEALVIAARQRTEIDRYTAICAILLDIRRNLPSKRRRRR